MLDVGARQLLVRPAVPYRPRSVSIEDVDGESPFPVLVRVDLAAPVRRAPPVRVSPEPGSRVGRRVGADIGALSGSNGKVDDEVGRRLIVDELIALGG